MTTERVLTLIDTTQLRLSDGALVTAALWNNLSGMLVAQGNALVESVNNLNEVTTHTAIYCGAGEAPDWAYIQIIPDEPSDGYGVLIVSVEWDPSISCGTASHSAAEVYEAWKAGYAVFLDLASKLIPLECAEAQLARFYDVQVNAAGAKTVEYLLLERAVTSQINEYVTAVDPTLSLPGVPADARTVGQRLAEQTAQKVLVVTEQNGITSHSTAEIYGAFQQDKAVFLKAGNRLIPLGEAFAHVSLFYDVQVGALGAKTIEYAVDGYSMIMSSNAYYPPIDTSLTHQYVAADAFTVGQKLGDVETALDNIIALQNNLIGGGN